MAGPSAFSERLWVTLICEHCKYSPEPAKAKSATKNDFLGMSRITDHEEHRPKYPLRLSGIASTDYLFGQKHLWKTLTKDMILSSGLAWLGFSTSFCRAAFLRTTAGLGHRNVMWGQRGCQKQTGKSNSLSEDGLHLPTRYNNQPSKQRE